jgi:hypothetical protein
MEVAGPKGFEWLGWTGQRGLTLLTEDGLVAESITVNLPPGVGWRLGLERRLRPTFQTSGVPIPLDGNLSETYPVEFSSQAWTWRQGALQLPSPATRFVRRLHYQDWANAPGAGDIPESNEGFWYLLRPAAASGLVIRPGLAGGISVDLRFNSGVCFSHFPLAALQAPEGGFMRITNNRVVPAASEFPGQRLPGCGGVRGDSWSGAGARDCRGHASVYALGGVVGGRDNDHDATESRRGAPFGDGTQWRHPHA